MRGLSVENLSFSYGARAALKSVSFTVEPGQFCALLGPNGAGKSTLFSLLTRLLVSSQGNINIAGHDMAHAPRSALRQMGVVFQQPTLDLELSVGRNLLYFAALHGLSGSQAEQKIDTALERLNMRERISERVRDLNGGHRRRLEIARSLLHDPKVLLLDEPTVGLDAKTRHMITDYVHRLSEEENLTVLWCTHLPDEVKPTDQLLILDQGTLLQDGQVRELCGPRSLSDHFLSLTKRPE